MNPSARAELSKQLSDRENVLDQFSLMAKVYSPDQYDVIEIIKDYEDEENCVILAQSIHELFYGALLDKGRHDIFFIYCTKHIAEQKQVNFRSSGNHMSWTGFSGGCPILTSTFEFEVFLKFSLTKRFKIEM